MKVAINTSPLSGGHSVRGIGIYTRSLLEALKNKNIEIQEFSNLHEVQEADIVHYPFFDLFQRSLPTQNNIPIVVTIHDVIPLTFPTHYPPGIKGSINNFLQKKSLKNISAIITDSESSKKEIAKYLGVPLKKIFPVVLAPNNNFHKITDQEELKNIRNKYNLLEKFALFTGNVNWNKNLLNLSEATLKAGIDLVLIGKSFESKDNLDHPEMKSFKEFLKLYSDNPKVHILGFIEEKDLVAITNLASVLLLPSFAEGFGLPILEAQVCGTPVITSNISSMPEVAGKGALLVNPNSVEDISQAITKIIKDKEIREELVQEGFKNVNLFSWEKTAQETIKVYEEVLLS